MTDDIVLSSAEACGYVHEAAVGLAFEHVLVTLRRLQWTEVGNVGPYLDVVELLLVYVVGYILPTAVPRHFMAWIMLVDVCGKGSHLMGCGIATHKTNTGDAVAMNGHHAIYGIGIERTSYVCPQKGTVASRTPTGAPRYINSQRGLVRNLLEHNVGIEIL